MAEKIYTIKIVGDTSDVTPQIKNLDKIFKETGADVLKTSESIDTLGRKIYSVMTSSVNAVEEAKKAIGGLNKGVSSFSVTTNPQKELDTQKRAYQTLWKDLLKEQDAYLNQQLRKQQELGQSLVKDYKYREMLASAHTQALKEEAKRQTDNLKAARREQEKLGLSQAKDISFSDSIEKAHRQAIKENQARLDRIANDTLRAQQALGREIAKDLAYREMLERDHTRALKENLARQLADAKASRAAQEQLGKSQVRDINFQSQIDKAHSQAIKENQKRLDQQANDTLRAQQNLGKDIAKDYSYRELLDRDHIRALAENKKRQAQADKEANAKMLFDAHNLNDKFDAAQKAANARAKELEQVRLSQFSQFLKDKEALLRADINTQRQVEISGMNSIESHRARANQQRLAAEQAYRNRIAIIESSVRGGTSSSVGQTQATAAMNAYLAALKLVDAQLAVHEKAVQKTETAHKAMWLRVVEVTAVYRLWTAAIQHGQQALMGVPTTGIHYEGAKAGLQAVSGSLSGAHREMTFLNHEAERTGLALDGLRSSFRLFAASAITSGESMKTVESIFANVNTMATTLHLSADDVNGIFLALGQTFNKGKLQSEELVKQLAQRVPGSVVLMAKAYAKAGETVQHATERLLRDMKMGNVAAHENIAKLGEEMGKMFGGEAFVHASSGLNAAIGRLDTSWTHLTENVYKATTESMMSILGFTTGGIEHLSTLSDNTLELETTFSTVGNTILKTLSGLTIALAGFAGLGLYARFAPVVGMFGLWTTSWLALNAAILASPVGIITTLTASLAALASQFQSIGEKRAAIEKLAFTPDEAPRTPTQEFSYKIDQDPRVKQLSFALEAANKDVEKYSAKVLGVILAPDALARAEQTQAALFDKMVLKRREVAAELKKQANLGNVNDQSTLEETQYDQSSRRNAKLTREIDQRIATLNKQKQLEIDTLTASAKMQEDRTGKIADSGKLEQSTLAVSKKYHEQINELIREKSRLTEEGEQKTLSAAGKSITAFEKLVVIMRTMESRGREDAVSPVGAVGRHQVMPSTLAHGNYGDRVQGIPDAELQTAISYEMVGRRTRNMSPAMKAYLQQFAVKYADKIADFGVNELRKNFEHFGNDASKALAAYNAGRGTVEKLIARRGENWASGLPAETRNYVREGIRLGAPKAAGELDKYEGQRSTIQAQMEDQDILARKEALTAESIAAAREKALRLEKEKTAEQQIKNTLVNEELQLTINTFTQNQLALDLAKITLDANKKEAELAKDKNFAGIELLKIQTTQARVQATLADAERKVARDSEFAGIRENELSLRKLSGIVTEKQYLEELQKIKESQLPSLEAQLAATEKITKEEDRQLAILRIKEQMRAIREPNRSAAAQYLDQQNAAVDTTDTRGYLSREATLAQGQQTDLSLLTQPGQMDKEGQLQSHETFLQQKNGLDSKYADANFINQSKYYAGIAGVGADTFKGITSHMIAMYGAQSKEAKRAFIAYKAFMVAQTIMNTAAGVVAQLANPTPYVGIALAAVAAAMGAIQVAKIIAEPMPQAHGGLEYVPEDATYKLSKGERVLAPRQNEAFMKLNRDLSAQMQRGNQGIGSPSSGSKPTIVKPQIKVVNVDYSSQELSSLMQSSAGEEIVVNHMVRNKESLA